jgi:hypothetical protein
LVHDADYAERFTSEEATLMDELDELALDLKVVSEHRP